MNYQKGFIAPLLVVLVAILLIGGAYSYVQSNRTVTQQATGLKTYQNKKYGFKFEYPQNWELYQFLTLSTDPKALAQSDAVRVMTKDGRELDFVAEVLDNAIQLGEAIVCEAPVVSPIKTVAGRTIAVTEQRGCTWDVYGAGDTLEANIRLTGQQYLYLRMDTTEKPQNHRLEFLQLIQSLQIQETQTINWKTYKNEALGLEVQYPQNWKVVQESPDIAIREWPSRSDSGDYWLSIRRYENTLKTDDVIAWINDYYGDYVGSIYTLPTATTVAGVKGAVILYESTVQSPASITTYIIRGDVIEFTCHTRKTLADSDGICDTMLESVKI